MGTPKTLFISDSSETLTEISLISSFHSKKNIFLTGGTGFVGKVILEKTLRDIPEIGSIYLFIRRKKDVPAQERLVKEIIGSKIFDSLRKIHPDFDDWVSRKIVLVEGNLSEPSGGISEVDKQLIRDNVHIFIHGAATTDFNIDFKSALHTNVRASLEFFQLAKECKNLEAYCHISTAFVSGNRQGQVKEQLNPMPNKDVENTYSTLLRMSASELNKVAKKLVKESGHPNVYTYTKCLTENLLVQRRENVPLVIVRPGIVGCSFKEPIEGWVDCILAMAGVYFYAGLGLLKFVHGYKELVGDHIPVDMVANAILALIAMNANKDQYNIFHLGGSSRNPLTWKRNVSSFLPYWSRFPPKKAVTKPKFKFIASNTICTVKMAKFKVPASLYQVYARVGGNEEQKKKAEKLKKLLEKQKRGAKVFEHFLCNEWIFDDQNTFQALQSLNEEDKKKFNFDVAQVQWESYLRSYCWGIRTFILNEEAEHPSNMTIDWSNKKLKM